jgi:hypothetical protein
MLPKSSKHYIVPTAEALNVDAQLVEDVVAFYYSELRKALSGLACHNIQVENLGTFRAKEKELPKLVAKYKKHLTVLKTDTFQQMSIKKNVEERLEKVLNLQALINSERERKKEFLEKKYGNTGKNI